MLCSTEATDAPAECKADRNASVAHNLPLDDDKSNSPTETDIHCSHTDPYACQEEGANDPLISSIKFRYREPVTSAKAPERTSHTYPADTGECQFTDQSVRLHTPPSFPVKPEETSADCEISPTIQCHLVDLSCHLGEKAQTWIPDAWNIFPTSFLLRN
ncbi:Hypothetical predicted protein [Pelobates cultripes]|uniref:Uncharacterized protein n=1 Tax=Pelobates cultripes TaxID=61616 RepID=A0AAD1R9C8_PELCU|nr:Hypothetical predicted protein [Pelobates cultripes]